jgi:hypothetical protein
MALFLTSAATGASILTPYNVIVSGNFNDSSDVGGGLAVGGFATLGTGALGGGLDGEPLSAFVDNTTLIAAGGASAGIMSNTGNENWYIYGTDSSFQHGNDKGGTADSSDPITFTGQGGAFTQPSNQSNSWAAMTTNTGTDACTASGSTTTCTVNATGLNIVNVQDSAIASGQTLLLTTGNGMSWGKSWVVINVTGSATDPYGTAANPLTLSGSMEIGEDGTNYLGNNGDSSPIGAEDVVFNFNTAQYITMGGSSMGSVLAPDAAVTGCVYGCQFVGSLVAASFTQGADSGTEFHNFIFMGGATPEPVPLACVGAGLIALALVRKRRRG